MRLVIVTLFWAFTAYAFVVRSVAQKLRTGDTGLRGVARDSGGVARLAGTLLVPAWIVVGVAPLFPERAVWTPGMGITAIGIAVAVSSQQAMGRSWRIGVAPRERTSLITAGPFRWVRNPFFTGMVSIAIGTTVSAWSVVGAGATALLLLCIVAQVRLVEEPHLTRVFGDEYLAYARRTGRFIPGVGKITGRTLERTHRDGSRDREDPS